jgi:asparagine synthase (glutamine-hydrolysing)
MCGVAGFLAQKKYSNPLAIATCMADTLIHRGPDDAGVWVGEAAGVGLAHRRLSIVDLSPAGHQPMVSSSGRYVIAFNGEIYNHLDLRRELGEQNWRGHSDTETLLAGIEAWGLEATLKKSNGMFAIALWDSQTSMLLLARDRIGEKPLYYGWQGGGAERTFLFGSELKALKAHPAFAAAIDRGALCLLLRHNYIPAPYSIYQGVA